MGRKITFGSGERKGESVDVPEQSISESMPHGSVTGSDAEESALRNMDSSEQASNAGRTAQSSDHMNQY